MSWIKDEEGNLVNLDHVQSIHVASVTGESPDGPTHALIAKLPGDEANEAWLDRGAEEAMKTMLDKIWAKLPTCKP